MLRVRDDDVLVRSSSWGSPFGRFRELHEWIADSNGQVVHVPTVLVNDIQEFPDCIEYMKEHTRAGTMEPEIHGLTHIDYSRRGLDPNRCPPRGSIDHRVFTRPELAAHEAAVRNDLEICKEWIADTFGRVPTRWYTPWGADNQYLQRAASAANVELVGTAGLFPVKDACTLFRQGLTPQQVEAHGEIFMHWWERGTRVRRLSAAAKWGGWAEAREKDPDAFKE